MLNIVQPRFSRWFSLPHVIVLVGSKSKEHWSYVESLALAKLPGEEHIIRFLADSITGSPLPAPWAAHRDDEGKVFYGNSTTGETTWAHPLEDVIRELAGVCRVCVSLSRSMRERSIADLRETWEVGTPWWVWCHYFFSKKTYMVILGYVIPLYILIPYIPGFLMFSLLASLVYSMPPNQTACGIDWSTEHTDSSAQMGVVGIFRPSKGGYMRLSFYEAFQHFDLNTNQPPAEPPHTCFWMLLAVAHYQSCSFPFVA